MGSRVLRPLVEPWSRYCPEYRASEPGRTVVLMARSKKIGSGRRDLNPRGSACFAQVTAVLPHGSSVAQCSADAVPCANAVAKSANPGRWAELPGRNAEPDLDGARALAMLGRHVIATSSIWDALDMALLDDDVTFARNL